MLILLILTLILTLVCMSNAISQPDMHVLLTLTAILKYIMKEGNKVAQTEIHSKIRILQDISANQCIKFICTPSHDVTSFKTIQIYCGTVTPCGKRL